MKSAFLVLGLAVSLAACSGKDDDKKAGGGGQGQTGCRAPVADDHTTGGCRIRLVTPGSCATVDVSGGKTYEFAWTTDGTTCELPYKAYLAGHPVTKNEDGSLNNVREFTINRGDTVSQTGGVIYVGAGAFEGLESDDGTYDWLIESFHRSGPASNVFRVTK